MARSRTGIGSDAPDSSRQNVSTMRDSVPRKRSDNCA